MPELTLTPRRIAGFNSHKMTMNLGSVVRIRPSQNLSSRP